MSYKAFEFSLKTEYVFAESAAEALKTQMERRKPSKVMLLALPFMAHIPTQVLEELGIPYVIRTDVISNPTDVFVNSCAAEGSAAGCDFVLGIGGGSVIDSCKAVALLMANPTEGGVWDYVSFAKQPENPALPIGLIVTIPSTGSESNPSAVISNDSIQEKLIYTQDSLRPAFSITSPELTYSLPAYPAGAGIADILSHLLEQYLHNDTHVDVSDNMLVGVMKAVVQWGPVAMEKPDSYDAKANLLWASYLAMSRVLSSGHDENWLCHMVEHGLSAMFPLAHGAGMTIVMPAYVDMVTPTDVSGRVARLSADVFGEPGVPAGELMRNFFTKLGMPVTLSQAGITLTEEQAQACAEKSLPWGPTDISGYETFTQESVLKLLAAVR
jgi:alcohol dehydrogenase YqhD (iron-dependent ADH family)